MVEKQIVFTDADEYRKWLKSGKYKVLSESVVSGGGVVIREVTYVEKSDIAAEGSKTAVDERPKSKGKKRGGA